MKIIKNLFILLITISSVTNCNKLEIPPPNIIGDPEVFGSEAGITAYVVKFYEMLPIETFNYARTQGFSTWLSFQGLGHNTGEYMGSDYVYEWGRIESGFNYWPYADIRNVNYFLENLPKYAEKFPQDKVDQWMGEAYFTRAYLYFGLVKRYGGVPIVDKVHNYPEESIDDLSIPRNKEDEVYSFIRKDLDQAIALLTSNQTEVGRANKYVAAALKSRVMLFAGSIAKYGTVQLDGLVGIPANKAADYYQQSYDAAKMLEGVYSLYRKNPDKIRNYADIFLDKGDRTEAIFVKPFSRNSCVSSSWDCYRMPHQMRSSIGWGSAWNPTPEFVELFGPLNNLDGDGKPIRFTKPEDYLTNIEPRLRATVLYPYETFHSEKIDVKGGIYESYPGGTLHQSGSGNDTWNGIRIMGLSGLACDNGTFTGFHVRKYLNERFQNDFEILDWGCGKGSEQDWIDIRYAEVLLNKAEAAIELAREGQSAHLDEALEAINDIRDRAGATLISNQNELLDIKIIQTERRKELAFENQTWWDLRRWRIAHTEVNHKHYTSFVPYYVYDENKYIWLRAPHVMDAEWTFDIKMYYEPIPAEEIVKNKSLVQNPLW